MRLGVRRRQARAVPADEQAARPRGSCSLLGYGLATPGENTSDPQRSLFKASHIQTRYPAELERDLEEQAKVTLTSLRSKRLHWAQFMHSKAIKGACEDASIVGMLDVGLPAPRPHRLRAQDPTLNISPEIARQDIIGMGCHAGLNSLKPAVSWACSNPGKYAVACSVE